MVYMNRSFISCFSIALLFFILFGAGFTPLSVAATRAQPGAQPLTMQASGSATLIQMQQATALQRLMPGFVPARVAPYMATPDRDMGFIGLPAPSVAPPALLIMPQPLAQAPAVSGFQAILDNQTRIPPDTMGAAGPKFVISMLNSQMRIQNKTGVIISTVSLAGFWTAPQTGLVGSPFDSHIIYDTLSGRWIAACTANAKSTNSQLWLAVSATANPTGVWKFYAFTADAGGVSWADFPGLGVNSKWIVLTTNMFPIGTGANPGMQMWVINKSTVLAGGALTFRNFTPGFTNNSTMIPALVRDAAEPNLYLVNTGFSANNKTVDLVSLSRITGTAANPVWSLVPDAAGPFPGSGLFTAPNPYNTTITCGSPGTSGRSGVCASQLGSANLLATGDKRIINVVFRNGRLWFSHAGGLPNEPSAPTRTAAFWYEVNPALLNTTGNPVIQSGVIDPGLARTAIAFPSIAVNKNNDVVIGFSRMDATRFVEAGFVSRLAADAPGAMSVVQLSKAGEAPYFKTGNGTNNRWGDYSATSVDPVDQTTFWSIQEYAARPDRVSGKDLWATWWAKIILQPTVPTIALALNGAAFNSTTNKILTLTETTVAGNPLTNADIYVALRLPDGTLLVKQPNGSFSTAITPVMPNVQVANFTGPIFNYTFTGVEPVGTYTWFAALMQPGTLNVIGALATAPFTFAP